ncbi:uncharacterized protein [Typha latifolia]|uniref:uncharacterized protein isoform X1 n=1 Tax=Typha latifolia TaxID=4733 RepID=UPI003C2B8460
MRFKKGSKVEVFNQQEVPSGSWRPAEIVSGNGHTHYVKYAQCSPDTCAPLERVPRKAIRPCPPQVEYPLHWVTGDILEVFDNGSWKLAEMSTVIDGHYYFVRLLGSSREFKAQTSYLRLRQLWQDDKWIVISKDSGKCAGGLSRSLSKVENFSSEMPKLHAQNCSKDDYPRSKHHNVFERPFRGSFVGMKRKAPILLPPAKACSQAIKKPRAMERDGRRKELIVEHSPLLTIKVDAVASPCTKLGEKYMHASLDNKTTGFSKMDSGMGVAHVEYQHIESNVGPSDPESTSSSVGSCSTRNSPYMSPCYPLAGLTQDFCSNSSDAETSSELGRDEDMLKIDTHLLELHAYRSTLMALYSSGPISWEQEALMTNLRLNLNISNDEHLLELRNLVSS